MGNMISAEEAEKSGLVARLFASEKLVDEAVKAAQKISEHSVISVMMAKEAVNKCNSFSDINGINCQHSNCRWKKACTLKDGSSTAHSPR